MESGSNISNNALKEMMKERGKKFRTSISREWAFFTLFYVQLIAFDASLVWVSVYAAFEFSWAFAPGEEWMKNSRMWDTY
jgi:hypothetical protein